MELSDLRIFQAVVRAGGITRAAAQLHRVQSNITTRVKQLEEKLGAAAVPARRQAACSSRRPAWCCSTMRTACSRWRRRRARRSPTRRRAACCGSARWKAPPRCGCPRRLSEYHRRYPDVTLELQSGNPQQLSARVLAGEIEAALITEPVPDGPFESIAIYEEELVIVAAAGAPRIASARDSKNRTILAFEPGCPHRKRLEDWFARSRQMPERTVEISLLSRAARLRGGRHGRSRCCRRACSRRFPAAMR